MEDDIEERDERDVMTTGFVTELIYKVDRCRPTITWVYVMYEVL